MSRKTKMWFKPLSEEKLRSLSLNNLKAYLRRIFQIHDGPNWDGHESRTPGKITKNTPEWKQHRRIVKRIIREKENVV